MAWKRREIFEDRPHCPHRLCTTLTPAQGYLAIELRKTLLLPLDGLLVVVREFINPKVSRPGLGRCLRRHGAADLKALQPQEEGKETAKKSFKDYGPGFLHIDIKCLPKMPDEAERRYLFVAVDRATRWVYLAIYNGQTETSSTGFLHKVHQSAPMKIQKILADKGSQFTDRFTGQKKRTWW